MDKGYELVYASHLDLRIVRISVFETEVEAEDYLCNLLEQLPWHEQVNYWVRKI